MPRARKQSEVEFLAGYDPGEYERPSLAVDVALLSAFEGALWGLFVQRTEHPFREQWALPGGFVGIDESLDEAAKRVLREKAGLHGVFLEQLYTFGAPKRDPRMRIVAVAYYALVPRERLAKLPAGAKLLQIEERMSLAFDHGEIVGTAVQRIRGKLDWSPIGYQLLPDKFTLLQLQRVHETVLGRPVNKDSFRRRMLASGDLEATGESERDVVHRPAELYRIRRAG